MNNSSSSEIINIAACTRKLDVDNRYSLRFYCRIADNILRQADIFRIEKNIIDLYIMLLRYSSLVTETIPRHRDYRTSSQSIKGSLRKKSLKALAELEELKPAVQQKLIELNRKYTFQVSGQSKADQTDSSIRRNIWTSYGSMKGTKTGQQAFVFQGSRTQHSSYSRPMEDKFRRLSFSIPRPKEETLSRHSILGPNGLYGQPQLPKSDVKVFYPSNIDLSPVVIPSLQQPTEGRLKTEDSSVPKPERSGLMIDLNEPVESQIFEAKEPASLISFETTESSVNTNVIRQPSPPPVLAEVQDLIPAMSPQVMEANCGMENPNSNDFVPTESPLQLHISTTMMESFLKLAKSNTDMNLETCGILAGILKNRKFYITSLIIPKQQSTSDSCQATNEEEIFEVQDKRSLFPLGWIHTHPTQSCFMSSIDLHTHYSYQIMLPEAVAIVMAPRDTSKKHGIFRLTTPGGLSVIRNCQQRGFHPHDQPPDGGPIYASCTDIYMNPSLKFDVIDLR